MLGVHVTMRRIHEPRQIIRVAKTVIALVMVGFISNVKIIIIIAEAMSVMMKAMMQMRERNPKGKCGPGGIKLTNGIIGARRSGFAVRPSALDTRTVIFDLRHVVLGRTNTVEGMIHAKAIINIDIIRGIT